MKGTSSASQSMYNREGELTYKREEVCERYAIGLPVYYNREGELTYKRGEVSEMYVTSLPVYV